MVHEDLVADIMMFYMVGYTRVGPRVDFTPDISTNSELQVAKIKFASRLPRGGRSRVVAAARAFEGLRPQVQLPGSRYPAVPRVVDPAALEGSAGPWRRRRPRCRSRRCGVR